MSENNTEKQAIERYCLECCDDDKDKVKKCFYTRCPLWKYRLKKDKKIQENQNDNRQQCTYWVIKKEL